MLMQIPLLRGGTVSPTCHQNTNAITDKNMNAATKANANMNTNAMYWGVVLFILVGGVYYPSKLDNFGLEGL